MRGAWAKGSAREWMAGSRVGGRCVVEGEADMAVARGGAVGRRASDVVRPRRGCGRRRAVAWKMRGRQRAILRRRRDGLAT